MGLNRYRNEPCKCGSGIKFKHCCLSNHTNTSAWLMTKLARKIHEKTAKYWRKRYKAVSSKPLNEPMMGGGE